jgi:hypothetical protein
MVGGDASYLGMSTVPGPGSPLLAPPPSRGLDPLERSAPAALRPRRLVVHVRVLLRTGGQVIFNS